VSAYHEPEPGEWIEPREDGYKMACCDCGLVHNLDFRVEDGRAQFRVFRNNRSTAMVRRHMKAREARQQQEYEPATQRRQLMEEEYERVKAAIENRAAGVSPMMAVAMMKPKTRHAGALIDRWLRES
jgi:hypothetical protein